MAQELELSDYTTSHELQGTKTNSGGTEQSGATPTKRRLLRIGILTLGVLLIVQATLNISLRLFFHSKEDTDQFPFNSSVIADMCQIDQSQQNSTQSCSCCKNLLRRLVRNYQALETERDTLRNKVIQLTRDQTRDGDYSQESGSGIIEYS
ncbi:hypothetical protein PFLUV_G00041560 [Perca fluviatilis]|uniref:Uncharacterized protein n=1 Tax=Perca fluviatilis TaxID=8168 RepID=A0A6A5FKV8_PERFL|nr:hypothetical protein PFLUV_G00041560 [Perca fluviatilis]